MTPPALPATPGAEQPATHLPGLDSLRFYAALLVLLAHAPPNLRSFGLPAPPDWRIFQLGDTAVPFFFTLSGFLITYLLLREDRRRGSIDVWAFYVRRALRIWPLYYGVAAMGLTFYWILLPAVGSSYHLDYDPWKISLLYLVFLPHLASSIAFVGGLLTPLWSIGVEEHFYLSWAPLVKRFRDRVPTLCAVAFCLSWAWFALHWYNPWHLTSTLRFVLQMKFHYMAVGGMLGWLYCDRREALLTSAWLRSRLLQLCLWAVLGVLLTTGWSTPWVLTVEAAQPFLFAWLIAEVAINPHRLASYGSRWTEDAGKVAYGFYLFHMPAIYLSTALARTTGADRLPAVVFLSLYYAVAIAITLGLASISWRLFEQPILARKMRWAR